ncbi:DUF945 family protein [Marinobacter sp.]|uniref:DUF945 family protein n=1 Tax=Marinobacter sp. TaxID=50741 RepID=UPI0035C6B473
MNAKWMIAGAGVLVLAGALPWGVGYLTQQQWQQATKEVNSNQPFVRLETGDYQRGILSSDVTGTVSVINPDTGESRRFDFQADVTHGVTGSLMDFEPLGGWSPSGEDWFPDQEPQLTLETRLWGTAVLEFEAPSMEMVDVDTGESLSTSGGLVRVEISDAGGSADALVVWPALALTGPDINLRLADLRVEQTMNHLTGEVWTGSGEMAVNSLSLNAAQEPPVTLDRISVRSRTEAGDSGQRLDSRVAFEVEGVSLADDTYGPQRLVFALEDLEVEAWNALMTGFTELQSAALASSGAGPEAFEQQMGAMQQVNEAVRDLAAAGFSLGVPELLVTTPEGQVTGSAEIRHPELTADEKAEMLMVMQRLTGDLNLSLPMALVEKYPEVQLQLAPLIKQGLLVQQGDRLVMNAALQDLVLDVNGEEIPLPPLL